MTKNYRKVEKELYELVREGLKGSSEKQNEVFKSTFRNKLLLKKAKSLASF